MITISIWPAIALLILSGFCGLLTGVLVASLCRAAAAAAAAYEADRRMFAGADALDSLAEPTQVQP